MKLLYPPRFIFMLLAWIGISGNALAENYSVKSTSCKVFLLNNKKWQNASPESIAKIFSPEKKSLWEGEAFPGKPEWVRIHQGKDTYLFPSNCVEKASEPKVPDPFDGSFSVFTSYLSWQESMSITAPSGESYSLKSTIRGVSLGLDWRKPLTSTLDYDISTSAIFASSDLGSSSTGASIPVSYSATGVSVFGVNGEFGFNFKPQSGGVSIGPRFALFYRSGNWPVPTGGYSISSQKGIYASEMIQTKFDLGRFYIAPTFGIYGGASNFLWSFALGYRLSSGPN